MAAVANPTCQLRHESALDGLEKSSLWKKENSNGGSPDHGKTPWCRWDCESELKKEIPAEGRWRGFVARP